jgi:hypothetical protein
LPLYYAKKIKGKKKNLSSTSTQQGLSLVVQAILDEEVINPPPLISIIVGTFCIVCENSDKNIFSTASQK